MSDLYTIEVIEDEIDIDVSIEDEVSVPSIGIPGPDGPSGTIEVVEVETLDAGQPASIENIGSDSKARLIFRLPAGRTGPAPTIFPGTVETGLPGSAASADLVDLGGDSYRLDLSVPSGLPGKSVELQRTATHIQWRQEDGSWADIIALADLTGEDGREVEVRSTATHIQWRLAGGSWTNVVALTELTGPVGPPPSLVGGTITTGAPGSAASGSLSLVSPGVYRLDLTIPAGLPGQNAEVPARLGANSQLVTNWNDAVANGWYMADGAANAPGAGWWLGNVEVHHAGWVTQTVHGFAADGSGDTLIYRRARNDNIWESWYRCRISEAELDARYLTYADRGPVGTANLNDIRTPGVWGTVIANATLARNYPVEGVPGALEVIVLDHTTTPYKITAQRFTTNETVQRVFIRRGGLVGGWSAWVQVPTANERNQPNGWAGLDASGRLIGDGSQLTNLPSSAPPSTFGAVGTYAFARNNTGVIVTAGGTVAGSSLTTASAAFVGPGALTLSGTWQSMGWAAETGTNPESGRYTLWLRIS